MKAWESESVRSPEKITPIISKNRVNGSLANLANSSSVVTDEFQLAEYKCETAGWVLPDGSDTFSVQVGMSRLRHLD